MSTTALVLSFVGIKLLLALLFWRAFTRGLELGERIEARKRAEEDAMRAAELIQLTPEPDPADVTRPAA